MKESILYFVVIPIAALFIGRWSKRTKEDSKKFFLYSLTQKLDKFMEDFETFKARLVKQGESIENIKTSVGTLTTSVTGIGEDVKYLKNLAAANPGGFTADQVADLSAVLDGSDSKLSDVKASVDAVVSTTSELDAETDPNANAGNTEENV